jgi:hypothetical protein
MSKNISETEFNKLAGSPEGQAKYEEILKNNNKYNIGGEDPIAWAATHKMKIEGRDAIVWAMEKNLQVKNKDPLVYAAKHYCEIEGQGAIEWAMEKNLRIKGVEPLVYAINKGIEIHGQNALAFAIEKNVIIEKNPPIVWAAYNNHKKINGQDPVFWAVESGKEIEGKHPLVYAAEKGINIEEVPGAPKDPCIYILEKAMKVKHGQSEIDAIELAYITKSPEDFKRFDSIIIANKPHFPEVYIKEYLNPALDKLEQLQKNDREIVTKVLPVIHEFIEQHVTKGTLPTREQVEALGKEIKEINNDQVTKPVKHDIKVSAKDAVELIQFINDTKVSTGDKLRYCVARFCDNIGLPKSVSESLKSGMDTKAFAKLNLIDRVRNEGKDLVQNLLKDRLLKSGAHMGAIAPSVNVVLKNTPKTHSR